MGFSVGVISGPREETTEEFDKRVAREMYTLCMVDNVAELDLDKFRKEIRHSLNDENASIHDILSWFDKLTFEEKTEIINKCSINFDDVSAFKEVSDRLKNSGKTTILSAELFEDKHNNKTYNITLSPMTERKCTKRDNFNKFVNSKMNNKKKRQK